MVLSEKSYGGISRTMSFKSRLFTSMFLTLLLFIGFTGIILALILSLIGLDIMTIAFIIALVNIFEWMIAPYIIEAIYHVRPLRENEYQWLHRVTDELSRRMRIRKPKLMLAELNIPNAFAYGSPLSGPRIAVTRGLLEHLTREEVEAVLGHELGHLKHHDVGVMMFLSLIPSMFFLIARYAMFASMFGGFDRRDRGGGIIALMAIAGLSYLAYFILILLLLRHSRLRELYADYESATNIPLGARKLAAALARIALVTGRLGKIAERELARASAFRALLIADPESYNLKGPRWSKSWEDDYMLAVKLASEKVREVALFSTHPPLRERLRRLIELDKELSSKPDYYR